MGHQQTKRKAFDLVWLGECDTSLDKINILHLALPFFKMEQHTGLFILHRHEKHIGVSLSLLGLFWDQRFKNRILFQDPAMHPIFFLHFLNLADCLLRSRVQC